jgi:hypothetical protein
MTFKRSQRVWARQLVCPAMRLWLPSSPRPPLGLAFVAVAVAVALLAGCGSSSPSSNGIAAKTPTAIVAAARAAAARASSAHLSGTIVSEGSPISLDLELLAGKGGRGQISQSGLSFQLIQIEGTLFLDGSPAFYRHIGGSAAAQLFQGKWLKAPATTGNFASIASLTNLGQLMSSALASKGKLTRAGVATVNGQRAVGVKDAAAGGTLYIATTGKPYPIEVVKDGGRGGKVVFDRWDKPVTLVAPADAIDITKLQSAH